MQVRGWVGVAGAGEGWVGVAGAGEGLGGCGRCR